MPRNLLVNGEMLLYGVVGDLGWGDDNIIATDVATALAENGDGPITARINSAGGLATEGMAIYSLLKSHPGKVTTIVDGIAASAASLIMMAGADRQVRDGAMVMIHDPAARTMGTEDVHRKNADALGKLAESYAGVYAAGSGKKKPDARAVMKAETWLSADDAVKEGFATSKIEDAAVALAEFDYRIYAHVPRDLIVRQRSITQPAATAAIHQESATMKKEWAAAFYTAAESSGLSIASLNAIVAKADKLEDAQAALTTAIAAKKDADTAAERARTEGAQAASAKAWAGSFYASAANSGLTIKDLNEIVAKSATAEVAKDALIDAMATAQNKDKPGVGAITVGAEATDKFVKGATRSIIAKAAMFNEGGKLDKDGERNEFSAYSLAELARMSLELRGVKVTSVDRMVMIGTALSPIIMSGAMSTSDFTNILANVANKAMLKGYEESPETFQLWTGVGTLTDFKTASRVDLGLFPSLAKVQEGAEYSYAKMSDRGVNLVLATYGKLFPITRQAIINDDLGAFTKIPGKMGGAARRTIGDLVYAVLTANANMPDGNALFSVAHANLQTGGGSVMSADSLDTGRTKMGTQKDPDNIKAGLNIRPATLLTPIALQGKANQFMTSQSEPGQNNAAVANRVSNMATVVSDARLDVASTTAWYLAANAAQFDTIEVDYLNGVQTPTLEQKEGFNVDGVEFKVRMDAGVNLLDYRGLHKSAGA